MVCGCRGNARSPPSAAAIAERCRAPGAPSRTGDLRRCLPGLCGTQGTEDLGRLVWSTSPPNYSRHQFGFSAFFFAGLTRELFGFSLPSRIFDVVVFTLLERAVSEKHVVHIFDLSNDQMVCSPIVAVFCGQTGFGRPHWCLPPGHSEPTNSVGGVGTPISKVFPANAAAFGLISGANPPHPILCSSGYAPMTIRAHPFTPGSVIF